MKTKIWKCSTNDSGTDVYVGTTLCGGGQIEHSTEAEMTNAHIRAAREAIFRYGEPGGVDLTGPADQVDSLPPIAIEVAWLTNSGSAETPFSVAATVSEASADPGANSLFPSTKGQQQISVQDASELPVNALNPEYVTAIDDAITHPYSVIYTLEAAIDMEEEEYCDLPLSMRAPEEKNEPPMMEPLQDLEDYRASLRRTAGD